MDVRQVKWYVAAMFTCLFVFVSVGEMMAQPVTIQMIEFVRKEEADWQKKVVEMFHATRDDIRIELVSTAGSNLNNKMLTMYAAGAPVDIGYQDPYEIINWAHQGMVLDVGPWLQRDQEIFGEFFETLFDLYAVGSGRYGVPQDLQIQAMFYDETSFNEAGVPHLTPGMTWDEIESITPYLTVHGSQGAVDRYAIRFPQFWHWWSILWHHGASFFDDERNPNSFTGDSTEMRNGLAYIHRLVQEKQVMSPRTIVGTTAQNLVMDNNVAMAIGNSLYMQQMVMLGDVRPWNVTSLPNGPSGTNEAWFNSIGWFIFATTPYPREAWEVLKFFSSEEAMRLSVEMRGTLVPHRRISQEVWIRQWEHPKDRHVFLEAIATARALPSVYGEGINAIVAGVNAVADGVRPIPQVIADWQIQLSNWLKDRR